jgi:flagellar P-ring protein precursor FlgI
MRKYLLLIVLICLAVAESPAVRIKDIAVISGMRSNQLMGVGLVAGLKGTGDTNSSVTDKALTNLLVNMGVTNRQALYRSKNIAVVMVTAELPAFVKPGQKIDVFVSSIGDATSLRDGNLLMTPIKGADDQVYAVAQGPIILGGRTTLGSNRNETVCKVVEGAIVEQAVPMEIVGKSSIALNLNKSDFSTATRIAEALDRAGYSGTRAIDPSTVEIPIEAEDREELVSFIARVQDFMIVPDAVAKVVINQRTGTVVIGENVRLAPVAISHGNVEIRIEGEEVSAEGESLDDALLAMNQATTSGGNPLAQQQQPEKVIKLVQLREGSTLSSLVKALNSVGTSPQDLIAILQGLKTAGALAAEIEVI